MKNEAMSAQGNGRMSFVVVDVGCIECGEGTAVLAVFETQEEAEQACKDAGVELGGYFTGGQRSIGIYETVGFPASVPDESADFNPMTEA